MYTNIKKQIIKDNHKNNRFDVYGIPLTLKLVLNLTYLQEKISIQLTF